jgi:hypothetical protein
MHYVSLIIEFLRGRPAVVFWTAALTQAALWTIFPSLFYSAPPGEVPILLAVGHELRLGSYLGPPLAFWLGELAFRIAGMFGVYLLAQLCVVVAFRAVFELGRSIVGTRYAVLAILTMVGISAFNVSTPEFGPAVLAMPFWALALLHYWRAIGDDGRGYWYLLALDLGLLLLTSYAGLILLGLLLIYSIATRRGRQAFVAVEPWLAAVLLLIAVFPHAVWLAKNGVTTLSDIRLASFGGLFDTPALQIASAIVASHLGAASLVMLACRWRAPRHQRAPEIDRPPAADSARAYVLFFALAPAVVAIGLTVWPGPLVPLSRVAPLILLSGLAVVASAGDRILIYRERIVSMVWAGLLFAPPVVAVMSLAILPWTVAVDQEVAQPAGTMGRFFADVYQRRTGQPLAYVAGDERFASLIALTAPQRPVVYFSAAPDHSPWATVDALRRNGAVLVWPATDTAGTPPAALKMQFPELSPELPRAFARAVQGRLPLIRVGWAMLRPQAPPRQ